MSHLLAVPWQKQIKSLLIRYGWALGLLLVAVPGLAFIKLFALAITFVTGTLMGDFRNRGWFVGILALAGLAVAYFVGCLNDVPAADRLNHLVRVASFYAVFACMHYVRNSLSTPQSLDQLCLSIAVLMAVIKLGILIAVAGLNYSLANVMDFFGFETVTLSIGFDIFRLQFPSDFVCLFLIANYFGRRSKILDFVFILSVGIVIFLSFSRFIFLCFFVGLTVRGIWMKRFDMIAVFGVVLLVGVLAVFGNELVERFVGEGSELSDETRVEQIGELSQDIAKHPLFGRGIGGAVPNFSRSESIPFSYEAQWYATVMQFGLVGTFVLILNVLTIIFCPIASSRSVFCISILVLLWILAGFTNPFITSLGSAVGLAITRQRALIF